MSQRKNSHRILAGILYTPGGIDRNIILSESPSGELKTEPFTKETPSTPFVDNVAVANQDMLTQEFLGRIEELSEQNITPEAMHDFLMASGVLSEKGVLLSIGRQSIIIDI